MITSMPRPPRRRRSAPRPDERVAVPESGAAAASDGGAAYATGYHAPVLLAETVDGLVTDPAGLYVDGTLGGGGHSAALLDALAPEALVVGIDQDDEALAEARTRLAEAEAAGRFVALGGNFADAPALLARAGLDRPVAGVLLDLGVSSHQIDDAGRGFAFSADGPLDMRMDAAPGVETAADLIDRLSAEALADLIYAYGEERRSRGIARAVKAASPRTTGDLANAVRGAVPTRDELKTLARVFQALRIAVNDEMAVLERALVAATGLVAPGGRLAVISYHSLEDRRAKRFLRSGRFSGEAERDLYGNPLSPLRLVTRRAITASDAEVARNPRSRSARLRIAERLPDDSTDPGRQP